MSISKNIGKSTLTLAICTAVGALSATGAAQAADNPFGLTDLSSGYMVADGKCGAAGKCGSSMKKEHSGKCGDMKKEGEGKCGGDTKKEGDGKCGSSMKDQAKDMAKDAADKMMGGKCGGSH